MTGDSSQPPKALLAEISKDLQPVQPSPLPVRLALTVAPFAILVCLAALARIGLRRDAAMLGPVLTWGVSIAQFALGIALVWLAARESTPARRMPRTLVASAVGAAFLMVVVVGLWTFAESPTGAPPGRPAWMVGVSCGFGATVGGTLLVIFLTWLFRHSLAARPALAGALYGAGAGIAVNAGWRLACPVSAPSHSLLAHGAAVVVTSLLGAIGASLVAKRPVSQRGARRNPAG
jgi:hypothetical protein